MDAHDGDGLGDLWGLPRWWVVLLALLPLAAFALLAWVTRG